MSETPVGTKQDRIAAARSRIEFWTMWAREAVSPTARVYFKSRLRHWETALKFLDCEVDNQEG